MNGERRPRPRRLLQYTSYTYIICTLLLLYIIHINVPYATTRRATGRRGRLRFQGWRGEEEEEEEKRFAPIRRDGRLPEHRRLITRSVYVYACTTLSETRLINHSSPGRTEAMDLHNCVHTHTHTQITLSGICGYLWIELWYVNIILYVCKISNFKNWIFYKFPVRDCL